MSITYTCTANSFSTQHARFEMSFTLTSTCLQAEIRCLEALTYLLCEPRLIRSKFITLSLPMLEAASSTYCNAAERLSMSSVQLCGFPTMLCEFREELASCMSSYTDLPLFIATELCQIKKDFSAFIKTVAVFVARVEAANIACTMNDLVIDIA